MATKNKYYAYLIPGEKKKGITDSWPKCEKLVKGKEARFKGFGTKKEAEDWLKKGANYAIKKVKKLRPGIYFDAGTGRGQGVEISVTTETGEDLLHKVMHESEINKHGKHLLLARPGGKEYTNNFGELLAMRYALKLALKGEVKEVYGDSKLVLEYWSKGFVKKDIPQETIELSWDVASLRREFEGKGGKIKYISGDDNPADLGFH